MENLSRQVINYQSCQRRPHAPQWFLHEFHSVIISIFKRNNFLLSFSVSSIVPPLFGASVSGPSFSAWRLKPPKEHCTMGGVGHLSYLGWIPSERLYQNESYGPKNIAGSVGSIGLVCLPIHLYSWFCRVNVGKYYQVPWILWDLFLGLVRTNEWNKSYLSSGFRSAYGYLMVLRLHFGSIYFWEEKWGYLESPSNFLWLQKYPTLRIIGIWCICQHI